MTLAVQLSGQIRYWNQSYKYWKKFKKYFNDNGIEVDFFLSCWDKEGKQYDYNSTGNLVNIDKSFFKDTNIETQNIKFDKKVSFDGSPTCSLWNLLISALSFSKYFLYSSQVVEASTLIDPFNSAGFNMFAMSMLLPWPVAPAPTIMCASSINKMDLPF